MTEQERCLWAQALTDYSQALAVAIKVWGDQKTNDPPYEVLQSAAATVLIHITKLREKNTLGMPALQHAVGSAPAAVTRGKSEAPQASVAVPPCPQCGGKMFDNRGNKKNPKGPDFTCREKTCLDPKSGYRSALWEKDVKKGGAQGLATMGAAQNYGEMPTALGDAVEDDLPF